MLSMMAEYGGDEAVTAICRQIDAWRRHQKPKANSCRTHARGSRRPRPRVA
jgi:hypothetical protein